MALSDWNKLDKNQQYQEFLGMGGTYIEKLAGVASKYGPEAADKMNADAGQVVANRADTYLKYDSGLDPNTKQLMMDVGKEWYTQPGANPGGSATDIGDAISQGVKNLGEGTSGAWQGMKGSFSENWQNPKFRAGVMIVGTLAVAGAAGGLNALNAQLGSGSTGITGVGPTGVGAPASAAPAATAPASGGAFASTGGIPVAPASSAGSASPLGTYGATGFESAATGGGLTAGEVATGASAAGGAGPLADGLSSGGDFVMPEYGATGFEGAGEAGWVAPEYGAPVAEGAFSSTGGVPLSPEVMKLVDGGMKVADAIKTVTDTSGGIWDSIKGYMPLITAGAQTYMADRSAKEASQAAIDMAQAGIDEQARQFDETKEMLSPFVDAGVESVGRMQEFGGMGDESVGILQKYAQSGGMALEKKQALAGLLGPEAQAAAIAEIEGGSEMSAITRAGENAILQNRSATGGLRGGNVQNALAEGRQSTLNTLINKQYERLGGLATEGGNVAQNLVTTGVGATRDVASLGQSSAAQTGTAGLNAANQITGLYQDMGAAAGGYDLSQGNAANKMLDQVNKYALNYKTTGQPTTAGAL